MFIKTLLGALTGAAIVAGSLGLSTTSASATYNYGGGYYVIKVVQIPKKVCEPIFKRVKWQDYYGNWHWKKIKVGHDCDIVYVNVKKKVWVPYVSYGHKGFTFSYGY